MASLKNTVINDTGFIQLPSGTTAQRPVSPSVGMMRYNSDLLVGEYYNGTTWLPITEGGYVTNGLICYLDAGRTDSYSGSGTTITDLSGAGATGTLNGSVTWVNAGVASYFNFPTGADADFISSSLSQTYNDFTIVLFPDLTYVGGSGIAGLIGTSSPSTSRDDAMRFECTGSGWNVNARNPGDANDWAYPSATTYYRNGVASNSLVSGWNIWGGYRTNQSYFTAGNSFPYFLGTSAYPGRNMKGRIAVALLYNRQLSGAEQVQNYNFFRGRFGI